MKKSIALSWCWMASLMIMLGAFALLPAQVSADGKTEGEFFITSTETPELGKDYESDTTGQLMILSDKEMTITTPDHDGTTPDKFTKYHIAIKKGITANITLAGVNIDVSGTENLCALEVTPNPRGAKTTLNLTLAQGSKNILKSGSKRAGLEVTSSAALVVNGPGSLTASSNGYGAGIGGGKDGVGGMITINSGNVTAYSSQSGIGYGAGIGGGLNKVSGTITINNSTVTAYSSEKETGYGAGVGGGGSDAQQNDAGSGYAITIDSSTVTACSSKEGDGYGAGIGGGGNSFTGEGGNGGNITIKGQTTKVTAYSSESKTGYGAGIGGGIGADGNTGKNNEIKIESGTVEAYSSKVGSGNGAGIGGGGINKKATAGAGGMIKISDGEVTACSSQSAQGNGAGIGGGGSDISEEITAGAGGAIEISGGEVTACSSMKEIGNGAGIGSGGSNSSQSVGASGGEITITGGEVEAYSSQSNIGNGAGIGGGVNGNGGNIVISEVPTAVRAYSSKTGNGYGAGIGGGGSNNSNTPGGSGGTITVTGGTTSAYSSEMGTGYGAGIGGGSAFDKNLPGGTGGTISIKGGTVRAYSQGGKADNDTVVSGAGIGGGGHQDAEGKGGEGGKIEITNDCRVFAGSTSGDGIGSGSEGSTNTTSIKNDNGVIEAKSETGRALSVAPSIILTNYLWKIDPTPGAPYIHKNTKLYDWNINQNEKFTAFHNQGDFSPPVIKTPPAGFTCWQNETGKTLQVELKKPEDTTTYQTSYQWYRKEKGATGDFKAVENAIAATYQVDTTTVGTFLYKVRIIYQNESKPAVFIDSEEAEVKIETSYAVTGQVINKDDNKGLSGVKLIYTQGTGASKITRETTTTANGSYTLTALPPGDGEINIPLEDYRGASPSDSQYTVNDLKTNLTGINFVTQSTKPPQVTNFSPEGESKSLSGTIEFTFDKAMADDQTGATVSLGGNPINWKWENGKVTGSYSVASYDTNYTITIKGFKSWNGAAMAETTKTFKTEKSPIEPSVTPSQLALDLDDMPRGDLTVNLGQGRAKATSVDIAVDKDQIISIDKAQLTQQGVVTVTGKAVGTAKVTFTFALEAGGRKDIEIPVEVSRKLYTVSGTITGEGGKGLAGAEVWLTGSLKATTGNDGSFSITGVSKGNYTLMAKADGYEDGQRPVNVVGDTKDFELTLAKTPDLTYTVSGFIRDKDTQKPLSGAVVTCGSQSMSTDSSGSYTFSNLPPGDYTINVTCVDYHDTTMKLTLKDRDLTANISMVQEDQPMTYSLSGQVIGRDNTPLAGVTVGLSNGSTVESDANGNYSFDGLDNGAYTLSVSEADYENYQLAVTIADSSRTADIYLLSSYNPVVGTITDDKGQPLAGAEVKLLDAKGDLIVKVNTDEKGLFDLGDIPNGSYTLVVNYEGYQEGRTAVVVAGKQVSIALEVEPNTYEITGKVSDSNGKAVPGATVTLYDSEDNLVASTETDEDGDYKLQAPNGDYTLVISGDHVTPCEPIAVEINGGAVKVKDIVITHIVDGYVKDKDSGEPQEGADVTLNGVAATGWLFKTVSAADGQTVQTDANGYYAFTNVEAGSYTITVGAEGYERTTSEVFEVPGTLSLDLALTKKADPTPQPDPKPDPKPSPSPTVKIGRSNNTGDDSPIAFLFVASAVALGGIWILAKKRKMMP